MNPHTTRTFSTAAFTEETKLKEEKNTVRRVSEARLLEPKKKPTAIDEKTVIPKRSTPRDCEEKSPPINKTVKAKDGEEVIKMTLSASSFVSAE